MLEIFSCWSGINELVALKFSPLFTLDELAKTTFPMSMRGENYA